MDRTLLEEDPTLLEDDLDRTLLEEDAAAGSGSDVAGRGSNVAGR